MANKLETWLASEERDAAWLQRRLQERGIARSHQAVRRIVTGKQLPNVEIGTAIFEISGGAVTANDFYGIEPPAPAPDAEAA